MGYQQKILTLFGTTGDSEQFGKTRLTIAGNTINEINKALKDLGAQKIDFTTDGLSTNLGRAKTDISAIFKLITQGSTETNAQLQVDLAAIQKYMDKVADKGPQKALQQFDKIMANASAQAKVYVQQTDAAALSTTAFAESQQRLAKISNTVIGGLKGVGASLLSMGVTLAVSAAFNAVVKAVYNAATAEKRYREAALDSATAVNERIQDTQSYIDQIKELREALDDGNLTENEAYETRKKLIGVQDELSEKYGDELNGIDLVNGGLEKQIGLLDEAAKKKANAFLTETDKDSENNQRAIETAQRNMSRFDTYGSSVNNLTASDLQILEKYAAANGFKQNTYKNSDGEKFSIDIAFQGDASGAEKAYNDFLTDVQNDKTLSQNIKDSITEQGKAWLQNIQEITSANEELAQQAAKYQIQTTTAYNELYENLAQAQKDYNEAVAKDDDIAIKKAVEDGKNAIGAIRSAAFNQSENDYHTDLSDANNAYIKQYMNAQADELESSTKLKAAQLGLQEVLKTSNTAYNESQQAIAKLTESEKQYGNVSNTNRDIIKWNAENMYKYRAAIKTHGWDVSAGDWSTAEGEYNEFGKGDNQIEIAYTPMLQTDNGLVPLTNREMTQYLDDIVGAATDKNGKIDLDKLFELDAKGLDMRVNSQMQHVNSMLAAAEGQIVDGVKLTGADVAAIAGSGAEELIERFGHTSDYVGKSMHDIQSDVLQYKTVAKDAFDDIDYSALTDYLDITEEDAKDIVETIKSSVQSLDGLDDLDLIDIGSLENAGTEITAYTKEQVQAYDNMKGAADKLGISMSDLIDILVKAGLVTGESIKYTNEFTANALSAATNATKAISLVTAAMQSQSTTAGVSSDSYSELIKEQGEYAAALDFENGYVKLNTDMAKKITQAKIDEAEANIKLAYSQNQMKYSQVKADLEALNTAVQQNGELEGENAEQVEKARSELEAQSKQLRENCRNLQMQYSLLVQNSGAYQDWVNAQNASEAGDMYDSIIKAKQAIAEGLKNGKIGTEKFKAAVELTIPEDYQGDIAKYVKRLNRYFKQASDGSADASGLNNFLKDSIKAGLMSKDAKDQITIAANKTTKDFADALHLSMEDVQSIWGELQEYGWEFDWGSLLGNPVDNLRMQIDDIQDQMDALGDDAENSPVWQALNEQLTTLQDKLKETFSSADASQINQSIEDIVDEATKANGVLTESQTETIRATGRVQNLYDLAKAQEELTEKQKEYNEALNSQSSYDADGNGKDNFDKLTAEVQQAQDKVTELTQKKEQLKDPTPLEISTFALDYAQGKIDGVEHTAKETTQMLSNIGCTVDTTQAQNEIDVQNQKAEQFTKTLSNVPVTLDTSTCQTKIANVSKAIDSLKREVPITLNFGVKGTIISAVSNGLSVFGKRSGSKSSDTHNSAAGTPNASGGKTLVGEIGNELVVNPHTGKWYTVGDNGAEFVNLPHGAIVFNHEKTQRLLKNGFVGGYGDALVSGNAMDAGSPGVGSFVGTAGNNYMPGKNPLVKSTYKATTASTKATKENSKALEENKKALEKQKTALEKQKTALEKESNKLKIYGQAALNEIEKREKALNKEKEAQDKAWEAEIDHLNEIKDAKDKELDATTKRIKEEKDAKDKAWEKEKKQLEEKKEALQDANDEEDRAIKLAELKDALAKAQANRTVRIYNRNQGFIWAADQEAVNDAQTALDDQMRDWKRDDVIKAVENEIDAIDKLKDAYDEETDNRLDDIDKEKEAFDEKIEAEIDDINKRKDAYDKAIEAEIEKLDEVKEKWNEAMSLIGTSWEDYQLQLAAAAHFTDMSLDGMSGEISGYKDDVLANMKEIGGVTDQIDSITESIEKLEEAISNAKDAASGGGGGSKTTDYSSLFQQGDGSDVGSGDDDSSSDGIVSKLENQRNAVENLRAVVEAASAQNKEYTKTEQELSKTLEDGNLVGAQRAGIMQEYTAAQGNTRQSFDLLIQKSKEYTQAIIDEKDISQGARDAEVASLAYLLERHVGTSDTITQILSDYATALTENTSITGEQYQNSIDMLLGVSDQAQLSGDQMQTVLGATTYAIASSTQMDNEQRQAQMDSIIALAQQHGASTEEIIGYLVNADIKMEESGVKTKDAHEKISAAVKDACKSLCLDYDTVIQKVNEAIASYKREQEEISKLVQARKQASVIANGFSVNGGGGSLATQRVARYATGVLNAATTHIAITDEKGPEIKMRKPSYGQYSLIEKGSSVIPAQPSANLWKFGLDPESFIASHMNQRSIKSVEITQPNMTSAPVVNVGDIQMYGVNDPDSFARVLHDRVGGIFAQEFSKR
nr:MAG TPA: hypothetical protein [Caudoviricetes sp.]